MNQITSAQMSQKSENVDDFNLHNEEYDPYIIVILNQLWRSEVEVWRWTNLTTDTKCFSFWKRDLIDLSTIINDFL